MPLPSVRKTPIANLGEIPTHVTVTEDSAHRLTKAGTLCVEVSPFSNNTLGVFRF